jgi:hypothetical protein
MFKVTAISAAILLSCSLAHAQGTSGVTTPPSPTNSGMAQPADIQNKPKLYQPVNPAPDTRSAPTSSSTGLGADNGGRPEEQPKK